MNIKKNIFFIACLVIFLTIFMGSFFLFFQERSSFIDKNGIIIILNGPSSAGKSSIQEKIQDNSDLLYLKMGFDAFFDALLPRFDMQELINTKKVMQYTKEGEFIRGIKLLYDDCGNQSVSLCLGSAAQRVIKGMHQAILAYAKTGNNIVVDYTLYNEFLLYDLLKYYSATKTYFVGVFCPLNVLEERERVRGIMPVGYARSHYFSVHNKCLYDLEVDTSVLTPEQCGQKILDFVTMNPAKALLTLKKKLL